MSKRLFYVWTVAALFLLFYQSRLYGTDTPLYTIIWLSLTFLVVLLSSDSKYAGFSKVKFSEFLLVFFLNFILLAAIFVVLEPLSGTFRLIIDKTIRSPIIDPAYYWITRYEGWNAIGGFFLTNLIILIFAEEIFFRGFLIQYISLKMNKFWGVLIQAFIFLLFIVILDFNLPPVENYIFLVGYSFFGRGIIGGWAAARTDSIWPSLFAVTLVNTLIIVFYFYYPFVL
ncbi:MAG: CPBP family glutamic-type intramembrane protease [Bacillota bacterium]